MKTCKGIKGNGEKCTRKVSLDADFCFQHIKPTTNKKYPNWIVKAYKWTNENALITAIIVVILGFCGNWILANRQSAAEQQDRYKDSALNFRPILELTTFPEIKTAHSDFYFTDDSLQPFFFGPIGVSGELVYHNKAKTAIALPRGTLIGVSTVESVDFRERLLSSTFNNVIMDLNESSPINPNCSLSIDFESTLKGTFGSHKGIFHVIQLYENEANVLFDVYNKFIFGIDTLTVVPTSMPYRVKVARQDLISLVKFEEKLPPTSYTYSKSQQDRVFNALASGKIDTIKSGIEIKTGQTQVFDVDVNEFWRIHTQISALPYAKIFNPTVYLWVDTIRTIVEIPDLPYKFDLDFDLQKTYDIPLYIGNIRYLKKVKDKVYKHCIVVFEDRIGNKFQAQSTNKLNIIKHKIEWEVVQKKVRSRIKTNLLTRKN